MFENFDSSFYSQISTQEIHPLQAPETQNATEAILVCPSVLDVFPCLPEGQHGYGKNTY